MSTSEGNAEYVTVEEAAGLLHRTDRSVRKLLKAGKLRGVNPTGRRWLIPRSEMQRFLGAAPLEPSQDMRSALVQAIGQAHHQELFYFEQRLRDRSVRMV
jgi:excisionase family DNA binding protein